MELSNDQEKEIKDQLLAQIENLPEDQKERTKKQIEEMSKEDILKLIEKNNPNQENNECIFCNIINQKTPSIKIDENEESIAVLDINPISKGHTLVIPKDHNLEPTKKSQELAFAIGERILKTLNPKDITTRAAKIMDHTILNVVPIFEDTDLEKRIKLSEKELVEVAQQISEVEQEKKKELKKEIESKNEICIFCSIAKNNEKSYKIDENKDSIAILEINPISMGHTIIVPKEHLNSKDLPTSSFTLAKKIAKKITTKFKPNDVKINPTSINNHSIIEVIPIYSDTDITKRTNSSKEEIGLIQDKLKKKEKKEKTSNKKKVKKGTKKSLKIKSKYPDLPQLPPRIP